MAPRAIWKGQLKINELTCPVSLHAAASTSGRVAFRTVNRKTGNRVRREYVDEETGKPVERDEQVKGYAADDGRHIVLEDEELASALPENEKTLEVEAFLACPQVDTVYLERPYFLLPADPSAEEAFTVIREGMRAKSVAAVARALLFRRVRSLLIRTQGQGLIASTLSYDYEVRPAEEVFASIGEHRIEKEMLDLARHIIESKRGEFHPSDYADRYDAALAELVKAKAEGRKIPKPKRREEGQVVDLMEALRQSAGKSSAGKSGAGKGDGKPAKKRRSGGAATKPATRRRKAG